MDTWLSAEATVMEVVNTHKYVNGTAGDTHNYVSYIKYKDIGGSLHINKVNTKLSDTVTIRYDPNDYDQFILVSDYANSVVTLSLFVLYDMIWVTLFIGSIIYEYRGNLKRNSTDNNDNNNQ